MQIIKALSIVWHMCETCQVLSTLSTKIKNYSCKNIHFHSILFVLVTRTPRTEFHLFWYVPQAHKSKAIYFKLFSVPYNIHVFTKPHTYELTDAILWGTYYIVGYWHPLYFSLWVILCVRWWVNFKNVWKWMDIIVVYSLSVSKVIVKSSEFS